MPSPPKDPKPAPRVAIIGLGACGLVTLKNFLEAGFDATGYDKNTYIGGLWKFSPENKATVLKTTVANLSKQAGCYTDFPYPDDVGDYPTAAQVGDYFDSYAEHFGLLGHVRLGVGVSNVRRNEKDEGWEVVLTEGEEGKEEVERFDKVVLCHGLQVHAPNVPKIEGIETFSGKAIHSNAYKGPEPFQEKKVLVVGMGNTGPDIACDLVGHASNIHLSHRKGHAIVSIESSP